MNCPNCGGKAYVTDTRPSVEYEQSTRRRYICYKCKNRFTTYEVLNNTIKDAVSKEKYDHLLKAAKIIAEALSQYQKEEETRYENDGREGNWNEYGDS